VLTLGAGLWPLIAATQTSVSSLEPVPGAPALGVEEAGSLIVLDPVDPKPEEISVVVTDVSELVEAVGDGVVSVTTGAFTSSVENLLDPVFVSEGVGTGIVIDNSGHILTNYHVIEAAEAVEITSQDGRRRQATVIGEAPDLDLALLKVAEHDGLVALPLGSSDEIKVGSAAIAIGNAFGLDATQPTVSVGIISALGRTIEATNGRVMTELIQTDAAINPGNSGGPLLNARGEVIGINSAIVNEAQNVGFAIAIDGAKPIIKAFKSGEGGPYLGIKLGDNSYELAAELGLSVEYGAIVAATSPGPGLRAGLRPGDVIVQAEYTPIESADDLVEFVASSTTGDIIELEVYRGPDLLIIRVEVGQRPTLVE